jgi:predicted nucleotidyltransferase
MILTGGREVVFMLHAGSHLYGTNVPNSDIDVRGVVIPKAEEIIGLDRFEYLDTTHREEDTLLYSLPKYIWLLLKGNPNVHEWLWAREFSTMTDIGQVLVVSRKLFLSKKVASSALGYLKGQVKKMHTGGSTRDLGAKRKALIEQYGFDTKNAYHAVRLARVVQELCKTGEIKTYRSEDREELLSIRNGALSFGDIMKLIESETQAADRAFELNEAGLADEPDRKFANDYLMRTLCEEVRLWWSKQHA